MLVESVAPAGDEPSQAKLMDLDMLVTLTGRERTETELRALLAAGGFTLRRVITGARSSLLDAVPTQTRE